MNYGDPRWDFRRLPDQLTLEVQYALQRSSQLGYSNSAHSPSIAVRVLLRSDAMSLLEHTHAAWNDIFLDNDPADPNRRRIPAHSSGSPSSSSPI